MVKQLVRIVTGLLLAGVSLPASAANKDDAVNKQIEQAIGVEYAAGKYDKAESELKAALKTCGAKACSREVLAKAHVALGIVRAKTGKDLKGARKEFEAARKADSNATIDDKLVSKSVLVEFYEAMGRELPRDVEKTGSNGAPAGKMRCTPESGYEIQTAQPIAVVCEPLEGMSRAELHYRFEGESDYTVVLMSIEDGTLRINIPCDSLVKPGRLELFVIGQDFNKEKIDTFGTKLKPAHYKIVKSTQSPVPKYPGQEPPKRCDELLAPGGGFGASCSATQVCKKGLYCSLGKCEKAPTCETDSECDSGRCNSGYCAMEDVQTEPEAESKPTRWLFGLHGGVDFWLAPSSKAVCGDQSQIDGNFYCYNAGQDALVRDRAALDSNWLPMTDNTRSGNVDAGFRKATVRVMASADYALVPFLSLGVRLGWAFGGGPRVIHFNADGYPSRKASFVPVHAELRVTYWFVPLGKAGVHPYVHLSGGVAEVDANIPIKAYKIGAPRQFDAWHKMGAGFAGAGGGAVFSFTRNIGLQLNINGMYMVPRTGIVLEPSLGGVVAF